MPKFTFNQPLQKLPGTDSSYVYFEIPEESVAQFKEGKKTRLLVEVNDLVQINCTFKSLKNGEYAVFVNKRDQKKLGIVPGDVASVIIQEHPHPLGVEVPEVLQVLLDQDEESAAIFNGLTDGAKRTLIFRLLRIKKDVDKQVSVILEYLKEAAAKSVKKG